MAVAPGLVDIQQMPLYDSFTVAVATAVPAPVQFFTVPIGGVMTTPPGGTKTKAHTNLTQAQRLEAPRSFECHAVRFYWGPNNHETDLRLLMEQYILTMIVGEKEYQLAPVWFFPQGGGVYGFGTKSQSQYLINGISDPRAINLIGSPYLVRIEQGENFRVELQGTTFTTLTAALGGAGLWMQVALDGVLTRQVQ